MARTTPAQKPRGEQSTIFNCGLACMGRSGTCSPGSIGLKAVFTAEIGRDVSTADELTTTA
jgi:hypothetical protein